MSLDPQKLTFTQSINASPKQAFYAFTHASAFNEWLSDFASVIPHPGGRIYLWWNSGYFSSGEITEVDPERRLSFTWHGRNEPADTQVDINFEAENGTTLIRLEHTGFGDGEAWAKTIQECRTGWEKGMENLVSIFETGEDLRYTRRPMLGILVDDFDKDIAKQLGVPVDQGIRIAEPIEGMGAKAAGLLKDDVMIALDGLDISDFPDLTNALQPHQAGDKVEIIFYRGSEKESAKMELSSRPIPEIPEKNSDLAKAVEKERANQYLALEKFLDGVSEEEVTFRSSNEEWSIKDNLAHLVQGERGWITWLTGVIGGYQAQYDDYGGNLPIYNQATLAAFPSVGALLEQLKRLNMEIVALIDGLPNDLPLDKNIHWRIGINLLEHPYHLESHLDQMKTTLAAARK